LTVADSARSASARRPLPAPLLVIAAVTSVQIGAALAKSLFDRLGPAGVFSLRLVFGAALMLALWRPRIRSRSRADLLLVGTFGLTLAAMNLSFYEALARAPLGIAVTLEFVGPLAVAVAGSRRRSHFAWIALAAAGILLLAPWGGGTALRPLGALFALLAGGFWALYILLSVRVGRAYAGGSGLAIAMSVAALLALPVGIAGAGSRLLVPELLAAGLGLALLSSALPWSLELEALRRLPTRVFGVLMSLEPAVAAVSGFVFLGERLQTRALVAIVLVVLASVGASRFAPATPRLDL
jgi:inner membrane transporter RhtA